MRAASIKPPGNLCALPFSVASMVLGQRPPGRDRDATTAADIITQGHEGQPVGPLLGQGSCLLSPAPTQFVLVISHAGAAESEATCGWFVARLEQ